MNDKLTLQPNPTFELMISVPVAGALEKKNVLFTVKHLPQSQLEAEFDGDDGFIYSEFGKKMVTDWDIDAEYNESNLLILFDNYPNLARLLFETYIKEYYKAAEKN